MSGLLIADFLPKGGANRSNSEWNELFEYWRKPASRSEEDRISRTTRMIREAIDVHGGMLAKCLVIPKGSYHSNTNVRANSDMDIAVVHPSIVRISDWQEEPPAGLLGLDTKEYTNMDVFSALKSELVAALSASFGSAGVTFGSKAIAVHSNPGTRVDADVVPALTLWNILPKSNWASAWSPSYYEGIVLFPPDGSMIINYPAQAHMNGVAKNNATGRRYKRAVRILKRMREELLENYRLGTLLGQTSPPSYMIESLCYNVPNHIYNGAANYYELTIGTLRSIIAGFNLGNHFTETNGIKPLFAENGRYKQQWSKETAIEFSLAALKWMGA